MSATNLLNLNVDTLFEQHSVPEIEIVQKKILAVVENKREELRTMVGYVLSYITLVDANKAIKNSERYRDLLKAADTIAAMQNSSGTLIMQVDGISSNCRSLNEQQLIGFKTSDATDLLRTRSTNKQLNNYFSTMVQIKLLTALPELIWTHIDQERFHAATVLFIFSRHVSTGLQLDVSNALMHALPVARKQWEVLKPFHVTIKQSLLAVLEREQLSAELASECLMSLLLLDKSNINTLLKTFLQLRCAAYMGSLADADCESEHKRRVKQRILCSLQVLHGTVELITKCFLDGGLLFEQLNAQADANRPPSIAMMDNSESHVLPDIIATFRPKCDSQALDETQLRDAVEQWLTDTQRIANVQLRQLFELVSTMSTIKELKQAANTQRNDGDFALLAKRCCLAQSLNFYEVQYAPLMQQRVRDIIRESWQQAMRHTIDTLQQTLRSSCQPGEDRDPVLWQDVTADLPNSLAEALSEQHSVKKLLMKNKGYSDDIITICADFNQQLGGIVSEMNVLLEEQLTRGEDKLALIEFLSETAQSELTAFISEVKSFNLVERPQLLLLVRLLGALVELCPNLKTCFCQTRSWRQHVSQLSMCAEQWQRMCLLMEEEAMQFWRKIVTGLIEEHHCDQHMPTNITHEVVLADFAQWETVTLEQKDEDDNSIQTAFRIPSQPRISLQTYLFHVIRSLNDSIPQMLPAQVLQQFNAELLTQLLAHYELLSHTGQNVSIQLYYDLKFLLQIFGVSREERVLYDRFQTLIAKLKDTIDPFDFELFEEHISNNIKRSVAKLSCQFGLLTPQPVAAAAVSAAVTSMQDRDPNVLCLSSNGSTSVWFPLLPIIETDRGAVVEQKRFITEAEKETTPTRKSTTSTRKSEATKAKSGAAAFFGAMSQEWFR